MNAHPTPELLAPAGSIESLHAAIEAGANAVYCGLTDFNARLRAKNFTLKTLAYVIPYAHSRNVLVYVTLNTLLKQADLEPAIHTLHALDQLDVDALIVTDLGLITIARKHFPKLALHGSTQMVIHNAAGVSEAQRLGLRRVILSRECTVHEIAAIKKASRIELEVFVHGALCYSISGQCLASSFLGGASGNRGRCTQVCRRRFSQGHGSGYYFSPRDLQALEFLPRLKDAGVASLKIEGRMKTPEYVYQVTRAYRLALDDPERLSEARRMLADDLGRKKTAFFLGGAALPGTIDAVTPGVGVRIGEVVEAAGTRIVVSGASDISAGDRVRIQPRSGFEGDAAAVLAVESSKQRTVLRLKKPVIGAPGDAVYLVSRHAAGKRFDRQSIEGVEPVRFSERYPGVRAILQQLSVPPAAFGRERDTLWVAIDDAGWFDLLYATPCQRLVFAGARDTIAALLADAPLLRAWKSRLVPALPPFIPESEIPAWRALIREFHQAGIASWMCSNIGHRAFFGKGTTLYAGSSFGILNRAAQRAARNTGFRDFVYSLEDDYLNIKAAAHSGIACLFSRVPLFVSRVRPAARPGAALRDPHGNEFRVETAHGLFYLIAHKPFCITHRRQKLAELGIHNFLLDLRFIRPDQALLSSLITGYQTNSRLPDTTLFNFKAGLK